MCRMRRLSGLGMATALAAIMLAGLGLSTGCASRTTSSGATASVVATATPLGRVASQPTGWYTPLLARADAATALAAAHQADLVSREESELASATMLPALRAYAADTRPGVSHTVEPALLGSAGIGQVSVLNDQGVGEGERHFPVWDNIWQLSQIRVGVWAGPRFMGEFVVFASDGDTETMPVDGSYSLAQRGALVLLWDHFGRHPFDYRVTFDGPEGSWVIGKRGKDTAGVFLGNNFADPSAGARDRAVAKLLKPGVVMGEKAMVAAFERATRVTAYLDSSYDLSSNDDKSE